MKWKLVAAIGLAAVGVAAIALAVVGPIGGSSSAVRYLTSTARTTDVVAQAVATGTVQPQIAYGLAFGSAPVAVSSTATTSSSSASSSSSTGSGASGSVTWLVATVPATVGKAVAKGDVLATADPSSATLQVEIAQANLAAAQARLATDKAGLTATAKAAAKLSITQAQNQLSQARQSQANTVAQNALSLQQAQAALDRANAALAADTASGAPANVLSQDAAAVSGASDSLASTRLRVAASNLQATNSITSAQFAVTSAQTSYADKTAPAPVATQASDQVAVLNAQSSLANAEAALAAATLTAPVDGIVTAVNVRPGFVASSGYAVQIQSAALQVVGAFAEADLPSLKLGQAAAVTLTATASQVVGTVNQINPVPATSSGSSSVVTYQVVVGLTDPPATTAVGMSAQIAVVTAQASGVIAVPATALAGSAGNYTIQVLDGSGQAQSVAVDVGLVTSSLAEIKSGITVGETVVTGTVSTRVTTTTTTVGSGLPGLTGGGGGGRNFGGQP
jgi:multidrug efflux pump subunit AcrA (membrane-fusion protein)